MRRVARAEYATDQALFAALMALCSLSSARVRDGALASDFWNLEELRKPTPEDFFKAAEEAMPKDLKSVQNLDYIRACALLAISSLQIGYIRSMHFYLGTYNMMVKMDGLHSESNWPPGISAIEREERRRLYWSMYTLEVFSSAVFGSIVSWKEAQSNVSYPMESEDEFTWELTTSIDERRQSLTQQSNVSWLRGWNFTTDMYRILEYAIDRSRPRQLSVSGDYSFESVLDDRSLQQSSLLTSIETKYASLPDCFKQPESINAEKKMDPYGFQAANIAATIQLLRMTLFSADDGLVEEKCRIVTELLDSFSQIPIEYLRAISTPLLHHLAGIGTILSPVFKRFLSSSTYRQVRSVLLALADFLTNLEVGMFTSTSTEGSASQRLRSHVARLDESVNLHDRRQLQTEGQPLSPINEPGEDNLAFPASVQSFSPEFLLPNDLLDEWSWAFDFAQAGQNFSL